MSLSLSQPPDGAPLRLPATAEEELSGDPKVADAPEMVAEDDAAEAFPGHELADQAPEASEDPVEQLRRCQSRCREVQTGRNEELYAVVADASLLGQRLKSDTAALVKGKITVYRWGSPIVYRLADRRGWAGHSGAA